jgi:hypothetical protein
MDNLSVNDAHEMSTNDEDSTQKRFLLTDESYQLLRSAQQSINNETDVTPTLRKMVNCLITEESVESLAVKLIEKLS